MHMKQSFACARMLLETKKQADANVAWAILKEISDTKTDNKEIAAYAGSVQSFSNELAGVYRTDTHFVPFYTKSHLAKILETYADDIEIYKSDLDRVIDKTISDVQFLEVADSLNKIYSESAIAEANTAYDSALSALERSEATYNRFNEFYTKSLWDLELIYRDLEAELIKIQKDAYMKFIYNFIKISAKMYIGDISFVEGDLLKDVNEAIDITTDLKALFATMRTLAETVKQVNEMFVLVDGIMEQLKDTDTVGEFGEFEDDIEMTVQLQVT